MNDYPLTLLYDGACPLCAVEMERLMERNKRGLLRFVDVTAPGFDAKSCGFQQNDLMRVIHGIKPDGSAVRGVETLRLAYKGVGLSGIAWLLGLPGIHHLATWAYPYIADNRYAISKRLRWLINIYITKPSCASGACDAHANMSNAKCSGRANVDG